MRRLLVGLLAALASPAPSVADCRDLGVPCALRDVSPRVGIWVGAAVDSSLPAEQRADVEAHFNAVTTENAFKWGEMEPVQGAVDFSRTDAFVDWTTSRGLRLRAHTLFWHRLQMPAWLRPLLDASPDRAATLRSLMSQRVDEVVGRYRGRIPVWDVVNEPLATFGGGFDLTDTALSAENVFYTTLGIDYIALAFERAHRADPRARLFLNEIVFDPRLGDPKADAFLALVRTLRARRVPIHGVGIQAHGMLAVTSPFFPASTESFREYLEAFRALRVKVEITELDVRLPLLAGSPDPLAAQAEVFARAVRACGLVRRCTGVTVWGLRDRDTWLDSFSLTAATRPNRPLLLDDDGVPKPAYAATAEALRARCRPDLRTSRSCGRLWPRPRLQ
jgi:endo-1,4-beta-xylanase